MSSYFSTNNNFVPIVDDHIPTPTHHVQIVIYDLSEKHKSIFIAKNQINIIDQSQTRVVLVDFTPLYVSDRILYYYFAPILPFPALDNMIFGFSALLLRKSKQMKTYNRSRINFILGDEFLFKYGSIWEDQLAGEYKVAFWNRTISDSVKTETYSNISELEKDFYFVVKFGQVVYELLYQRKLCLVISDALSPVDSDICKFLESKGLIVLLKFSDNLSEVIKKCDVKYSNFINCYNLCLNEKKIIFPSQFRL